ncbi:GGDEF domain-containing protein [Acidiferrimicrobium sp. IK]|uniref:GGDEF domain-containing protein n=1 Tax=Acidiferrimicrobium sp. IK TaxID=2871700 RepID=UPI0021CB790C|nr:GGDEF domain-containing protein [Acidiferrimicrobium sp. IK]MCU4185856.1 GGDEF domain-containing protein [Acidiferrimicrobium sp. IK]
MALVEDGPGTLLELPGLLVRADSGIAFIYQALDVLALRFGLDDAVVVVEPPAGRRQAFRLQRRVGSPRPGSSIPPVALARPGLYADPPSVDSISASYLVALVEVALRLDLLRHDASRDPLTGLLNRRSYEEVLLESTARSRRYGWPFALVLLDLDHFKDINDQWGHGRGDEALRTFGSDLRACLRTGDVAARVGGDEFALLVHAVSERDEVMGLVERLRVSSEISAGGTGLRFSAGVAFFPDDATEPAALTKVADSRLYADKGSHLARPDGHR